MSIPSGYVAWCVAQGCSVHHPSEWGDEDRAAFAQWKFEDFLHKMALFAAFDQWRIMGPDATLSRIREWTEMLTAPPPTRPYTGPCPCHPFVPLSVKRMPEPKHGVEYIRSFRRKET